MTHVVLGGLGEVGSAVRSLLPGAVAYDIAGSTDLPAGEFVGHVCIPYGPAFVDSVSSVFGRAGLVLVWSTVPVGTCGWLADRLNCPVYHLPVRGRHPEIAKGLTTFRQFVGATRLRDDAKVEGILAGMGIADPVFADDARTTEFAKLCDTTYYGVCIAFANQVRRECDRLGLPFETVYSEFNRTYNAGYASLGLPQFVRPTLTADRAYDGIGGHCVSNNAALLRSQGLLERAAAFVLAEGVPTGGRPSTPPPPGSDPR